MCMVTIFRNALKIGCRHCYFLITFYQWKCILVDQIDNIRVESLNYFRINLQVTVWEWLFPESIFLIIIFKNFPSLKPVIFINGSSCIARYRFVDKINGAHISVIKLNNWRSFCSQISNRMVFFKIFNYFGIRCISFEILSPPTHFLGKNRWGPL